MPTHRFSLNRLMLGQFVAVACAVCLSTTSPASAQKPGLKGKKASGHPISARLVSDADALVPGGEATLALVLDIRSGWYTYWRNPGETGLPVNAVFDAPEGVEIGQPMWPAPKRKVLAGGILDYVYTGQAVLLFPVRASGSLQAGAEVTIRGSADWLVCEESCIPGSQEVSITLPVRASASTASSELFQRTRARLATRVGDESRVGISVDDSALEIAAPGATGIRFYPFYFDELSFVDPIADGESDGEQLRIGFEGEFPSGAVLGEIEVIRGGKSEFYVVAPDASGGG